MTQFNYIPNEDLKEYAVDVTVTRPIDHAHISVVISDFVDFLKAIGFQSKSIEKYIPDFDPQYDCTEDYLAKTE